VNINLKRKPEWYQDVCPSGHVPCIQHDDGRAVYESFIICEYIVRNFIVEKSMIFIGPFNLILVVRLPGETISILPPSVFVSKLKTLWDMLRKSIAERDGSETIM